MDPNAIPANPDEMLAKMLTVARATEMVNENPDGCAEEDIVGHAVDLATTVLALDEHLAAGGIPPTRWTGTATETRGKLMQAETDRLEDHLRGCREQREAAEAVGDRAITALRTLLDAEREFAEFDAELVASEEANHKGGPPDSLVEEHGEALRKRDAAREAAQIQCDCARIDRERVEAAQAKAALRAALDRVPVDACAYHVGGDRTCRRIPATGMRPYPPCVRICADWLPARKV